MQLKPYLAGLILISLIVSLSWTGSAEEFTYHAVAEGDTLYSLAKSCDTTVEELMDLNGLSDNTIRVGDFLKLPVPEEKSELPVATVSVALALPQPTITEQDPVPEDRVGESSHTGTRVHLSADEFELLAQLVHAEARGEPTKGKVAVAAVVLNRVRHSSFPNTVQEVIYEPGQFLSVENGMISLEPTESCREAVKQAINGQDPTGGALFFYNPQKSKALAWWKTRTTTAVIGNHNFAI